MEMIKSRNKKYILKNNISNKYLSSKELQIQDDISSKKLMFKSYEKNEKLNLKLNMNVEIEKQFTNSTNNKSFNFPNIKQTNIKKNNDLELYSRKIITENEFSNLKFKKDVSIEINKSRNNKSTLHHNNRFINQNVKESNITNINSFKKSTKYRINSEVKTKDQTNNKVNEKNKDEYKKLLEFLKKDEIKYQMNIENVKRKLINDYECVDETTFKKLKEKIEINKREIEISKDKIDYNDYLIYKEEEKVRQILRKEELFINYELIDDDLLIKMIEATTFEEKIKNLEKYNYDTSQEYAECLEKEYEILKEISFLDNEIKLFEILGKSTLSIENGRVINSTKNKYKKEESAKIKISSLIENQNIKKYTMKKSLKTINKEMKDTLNKSTSKKFMYNDTSKFIVNEKQFNFNTDSLLPNNLNLRINDRIGDIK